MATGVPEDKDQNVETCKPMREKYWSELDDRAKMERMRSVISGLRSNLRQCERLLEALRKHSHGNDGTPLCPLPGEFDYLVGGIPKDDVYF